MAVDAPGHARGFDHARAPASCCRRRRGRSRTSTFGARVRAVVEVDHRRRRHHVDLAPDDRLAALVELHQLDDLGMIGNAAAMAADAERHRRQPRLRRLRPRRSDSACTASRPRPRAAGGCRRSAAAAAGAASLAAGEREAGEATEAGARAGATSRAGVAARGGYPRPAMPVDRATLARLYAGEQGRAWDRIERERPSTYWEENVVGGRRLARRTIVHWLEPLTRRPCSTPAAASGSLGAHLAGLGARCSASTCCRASARAPRVKGLRFAIADVRAPVCPPRHVHHRDPRRGARGLSARGARGPGRRARRLGRTKADPGHARAEHHGRLGRSSLGARRPSAGRHRRRSFAASTSRRPTSSRGARPSSGATTPPRSPNLPVA